MIDYSNKSLDAIISDINKDINRIKENPIDISKNKIPTSFEIAGIPNSGLINILFSDKVDKIIDFALDAISSGNIEAVLSQTDAINKIFAKFGIDDAFQGEISTTVINTIKASVESPRFNMTKNKLSKALIVLKDLKAQAVRFKDRPDMMKKYKDALHAIKKVTIFAAKVYHNRRMINDRVKRGLYNIVKEDNESIEIEEYEKIEF